MPRVEPLGPTDPGEVGGYRLAGRLGRGGQGTVFLAHRPDGDPLAIKVLHRSGDSRVVARFRREVDATQRVVPFCTARVLGADLDADPPYLVSEFIDGPTLHDRVKNDGPLSGPALDRVAVGTITALTAIHEAGVVHRDFKPENVVLSPDGPRVVDFGIARLIDTTQVSNEVMGTPAYMAPEQFADGRVGTPADVFAWAEAMVFAASGRPPYGDDAPSVVMHRVFYEPPNLGGLTGGLRELIAACLAGDATARPAAADVLLSLLGQPASQGEASGTVLARGARMADAPSDAAPYLGETLPPDNEVDTDPPVRWWKRWRHWRWWNSSSRWHLSRRWQRWVIGGTAVIAAVGVVMAVVLGTGMWGRPSAPADSDVPPTDAAASSLAVPAQASQAVGAAGRLTRVFLSFDHRIYDTQMAEMAKLSTPRFRPSVLQQARDAGVRIRAEQFVATAVMKVGGVMSWRPGRAVLLIFADTRVRNRDVAEPELVPRAFQATVVRRNGEWLLDELTYVDEPDQAGSAVPSPESTTRFEWPNSAGGAIASAGSACFRALLAGDYQTIDADQRGRLECVTGVLATRYRQRMSQERREWTSRQTRATVDSATVAVRGMTPTQASLIFAVCVTTRNKDEEPNSPCHRSSGTMIRSANRWLLTNYQNT